jgi:hypothetical protein
MWNQEYAASAGGFVPTTLEDGPAGDGKTATRDAELAGSGLKMPVVWFSYVPRKKSQ